MIDYYYSASSVSSYKIKIMNRPKVTGKSETITDFLKHVGLVAVSSKMETPLQSLKMRTEMQQYSPTHFFGLFFLDSFITLKTDSMNIDNQLRFNTGPLIAIDKSGGVSAKSPRKLSMRMAEYFGNSYIDYYAKHLDISNDQLLMRQYVDSQTELFKFIKKEIIKKVITGNFFGDRGKNNWFATKLIQRARQELYVPSYDLTQNYLRRQLEDQLNDDKEIIQLSFHNVKFPGTSKDFVLTISQSDVLNTDFRSWGYSRKLYGDGVFKNLKPAYMNQIIQDKANVIEDLITILTEGEKKARIFILTDTGDASLGYQYLVPQQTGEGDIYVEALKSREWLPKNPSYFDVDLTNSQNRLILEHLAKILLGTTDLIVVKEAGGTLHDGKMLFACNQYEFLGPNEILSEPSDGKVYDAYHYDNYQMVVTEQKYGLDSYGWSNFMGWSFGPGSEFHTYLNSIFDDSDNYLNQYLVRYTSQN